VNSTTVNLYDDNDNNDVKKLWLLKEILQSSSPQKAEIIQTLMICTSLQASNAILK